MSSTVLQLDVLIASPGDASTERDAVERQLHEWNNHRGDAEGVLLRPRRWEMAAVAISGRGDAQSIINGQLVDQCDIVIAVFYHKLGTATKRDISGTAEEINRSVKAGKFVHLFFADKDLPSSVDIKQLEALRTFRRQVQEHGLIASYTSEYELRFLVDRAIEHDVREIKVASSGKASPGDPPDFPKDEGTKSNSMPTIANSLDAVETVPPGHNSPRKEEPSPLGLESTDGIRIEFASQPQDFNKRLWTMIAMVSAAVFVAFLIMTPKPPEPAPAWVAVPGVVSFGLLITAAVRIFRHRSSRHRGPRRQSS